jgi:hypothetical protein
MTEDINISVSDKNEQAWKQNIKFYKLKICWQK